MCNVEFNDSIMLFVFANMGSPSQIFLLRAIFQHVTEFLWCSKSQLTLMVAILGKQTSLTGDFDGFYQGINWIFK